METEIRLNDIADDLLILNKITIDKLFNLDNCSECISLYLFYYKTAKWQKTNIIKANDSYIKKSLKWGTDKIRKTKQTLKENGLINIVQRREEGKIKGWYVEVSYLVSQKKIEDIKIKVESNDTQNQQVENIKNTQNQQVENSTSGNQETNALKENNNCLKKEDEMLEKNIYIDTPPSKTDNEILEEEFEKLWKLYPKKVGKDKSFEKYKKYRTSKDEKDYCTYEEVLSGLEKYLKYIELNKNWYKPQDAKTWFNNKGWKDERELEEQKSSIDDVFDRFLIGSD